MLPKCIRKRQLGKACQHAANHGIGCDEYAEIVAWAGPNCQICGIHGPDTPRGELVLDHLDEHGHQFPHKIRGMVCDKCNALMSKVDGRKNWGTNRAREVAARRYVANAWYMTHPAQPPHRIAEAITSNVRFAFTGVATTARLHQLVGSWNNSETNRSVCGFRVSLPAHPDVVAYYRMCRRCDAFAN